MSQEIRKTSEEQNEQQPTAGDTAPPSRAVVTAPIDIYETEEGLVLMADLPGVTTDTLELQVQDNKLTIFGRVTPVAPAGARLLHREYEQGDFLRSFILSDEVDYDGITAKLNNGVLEVNLPRMPRAEPRRIQVDGD
ncbi:Hsp20/alpha crystallin family protein [Symmachiella dynata]|uniref:Spore protein SP21 n=1 Tax=Symmachiella dynata TaxID=2527995 RepID=A0A517ZSI3_9PLAN|nr:Hsp20/alpha crystallin family protein [Symmachiella dynata]QDU45447.1 Spore protein SP21 [Symmachiella dynata]